MISDPTGRDEEKEEDEEIREYFTAPNQINAAHSPLNPILLINGGYREGRKSTFAPLDLCPHITRLIIADISVQSGLFLSFDANKFVNNLPLKTHFFWQVGSFLSPCRKLLIVWRMCVVCIH